MSNVEHLSPLVEGEHQHSSRDSHARSDFLNAVVTLYYARVVKFLRRRRLSVDDAQDVAQEAFARLSAANLSEVRAPGPLLFTIAGNLVRDRARSAEYRLIDKTLSVSDMSIASSAPDAHTVLSDKEQLALLETALAELNPKCRAVFVMYRYDEKSHKQIADSLGISVSMVEKYVRQALQHCRERLAGANNARGEGIDVGS
ncbi:MAG: sigma-70 family RNA polymerase sigma factor [Rhodospirillaceae bacterium]|nr:sigma-70 family RNA polymerase sigma factor [Rhodospirillaceae bacterium]